MDGTGGGNDGIIWGADWGKGLMGNALEFDGIDDFVEIPHAPSINLTEDISISVWIRTSDNDGIQKIILDKRSDPKKGYTMALDHLGRAFFQIGDGVYNPYIAGGADLRDGMWHNIIGVRDSGTKEMELFVDGDQVSKMVHLSMNSIGNTAPMKIGAASCADIQFFNGSVDEIVILDRALTIQEIRDTAQYIRSHAVLRSDPITLPGGWTLDALSFSRYIPENAYLNISIRDAGTNQILLIDNSTYPQAYHWANHIDPFDHPVVYLFAEFHSNGSETPVLYNWSVNWTDKIRYHLPDLLSDIPDILVAEDTVKELDMDHYFEDVNTPPLNLSYTVINLELMPTIVAAVNGSKVLFRSATPNWTGFERFQITCTNEEGLWDNSNIFLVVIQEVDDPPEWKILMLDLVLDEDHPSNLINLSVRVEDAEGHPFDYLHEVNDTNIDITIENKTMLIEPAENWSGSAQVNLTVYQKGNPSLYSNTSFNVSVLPVNDPLVTTILFPVNGSKLADTKTPFRWIVGEDNDGPEPPIYYVYISRLMSEVMGRAPSALHITNKSYLNLELEYGIYYWTVLGNDGEDNGTCSNGYSQFYIDLESSIPDVELYVPVDGSKVNATNTTLTWHCCGEYTNIDYMMYFGSYPNWTSMDVIQINATNTEYVDYHMTGLINGETYYWFVLPRKGNSVGRCISGMWNFTVDLDYERIFNITITTNTSEIRLNPGKNYNFTFTLMNNGNENESIGLSLDEGIFPGSLDLEPDFFVLCSGEEDSFQLRISVPEDINVENYTIWITATISFGDMDVYEKSYPLTITIVPEEPIEIDDLPSEEPTFNQKIGRWFRDYWELSIALLSGFAFLFGYLRLRKKKGKFLRLRRQIDNIYKNLSDKPDEAIISMESLSSHLTHFMDTEQITDNQYMILERKINDYILDFRGSARLIQLRKTVKDLPSTVRQKVVEILEDGRVTREEFDSFEGLLGKEDISDGDRDVLGKFVGQWLKEDTGEDVEVEHGVDRYDSSVIEDDGPMLKNFSDAVDDTSRKGTSVHPKKVFKPRSRRPVVRIPKLLKNQEETLLFQDENGEDIRLEEEKILGSAVLSTDIDMKEFD